jgi:hypothetical protein
MMATDWPKWTSTFLAALESSPSVKAAAAAAGVARSGAYALRASDPDFRAAWEDALSVGVEELEAVAFQRAKDSSDVLAIFLLKAHRPERYREMARPPGATVRVEYVESPPPETAQESEEGDPAGGPV